MPIYEYRCDACGHLLEALQKISDERLRVCPACEAEALRRLVSAPSFRLKGGGWYETDFKSDKERKRNLAESGEGAMPSEQGDSAKSKEAKKSDQKESATSANGSGKRSDGKDSGKGAGKASGSKDSSSAVA